MLAQVGGYYSALLTGSRGVTKGKPCSPTIFNMLVNAVMHHWSISVAGEEAGPETIWKAVQKLAALLYVDRGLLAYPRPSRLQ